MDPCTDDAVDEMILTIVAAPTAYAGEDDKICENESYTLQGEAENFDYTVWTTSGDGTFDNNTLLDATYYPGPNDIIVGYADLTLTSYPMKPCADPASDQMTLSIDRVPDKPATPVGPEFACANDIGSQSVFTTDGSPNALSYVWSMFPETAGTIEGEGTEATITWNGQYFGPVFVSVQGVNECGGGEFSDAYEIDAHDCTGLPEDPSAALNINVYPNPSDGRFNIEISGMENVMELFIVDYKGQLLYQDKVESENGEYLKHLDISTYPKGIYFLKIVDDNVMRVEKIVIR
jgi:hypothetical protein